MESETRCSWFNESITYEVCFRKNNLILYYYNVRKRGGTSPPLLNEFMRHSGHSIRTRGAVSSSLELKLTPAAVTVTITGWSPAPLISDGIRKSIV